MARVERFTAVFHSYVCAIAAVTLGSDDERYRKILYFTVLEALAKARYPKDRPGDAFSSFIVNYCGFADGERVSLPHLVGALERTAENAFTEIRNFAFDELRKWGTMGPIGVDKDPARAEIQRRWPKTSEGSDRDIPELRLRWAALQHRNLLYAYRSKLSHESREATMSFEAADDVIPYYESVRDGEVALDSQETEWHLVYPSAFLAAACRSGIEGLKTWLLENSINPYGQFLFGHYLVEDLNQSTIPVHAPFRRRVGRRA